MQFALIESLLWDGKLHREDNHVDRMFNSALHFNIPISRAQIYDALNTYILNLSKDAPSRFRSWIHKHIPVITKYNPIKIRVLLYKSGELKIEHSAFKHSFHGRVMLANQKINSSEPYLFHKTTMRELFNENYAYAQANKYDDALFFNEREELTEGCIHNVFIAKNKKMYTPPIYCGLLPGIYRGYFLNTNKHAEERVLTMDDLKSADAIYLCNSVRGIYEVSLNL